MIKKMLKVLGGVTAISILAVAACVVFLARNLGQGCEEVEAIRDDAERSARLHDALEDYVNKESFRAVVQEHPYLSSFGTDDLSEPMEGLMAEFPPGWRVPFRVKLKRDWSDPNTERPPRIAQVGVGVSRYYVTFPNESATRFSDGGSIVLGSEAVAVCEDDMGQPYNL